MKSSFIGITVLAILCTCSSVNADDLTKREKAALDFSYEKIGLGTTLEDFKQRFPKAELRESDKSTGTSSYIFEGSDKKLAVVTFFRERIYHIMFMIPSKSLSEIGGRLVLEKKIKDTFGIPNISKGGAHQWTFPNVERAVQYTFKSDVAAIVVYDTGLQERLVEVKASNLDLGF